MPALPRFGEGKDEGEVEYQGTCADGLPALLTAPFACLVNQLSTRGRWRHGEQMRAIAQVHR